MRMMRIRPAEPPAAAAAAAAPPAAAAAADEPPVKSHRAIRENAFQTSAPHKLESSRNYAN